MEVTVNGKAMELSDGMSLAGLLNSLGLSEKRVAVEHNRKILPCGDYAGTVLKDGDTLEILSFVGGG